MKKFKKHSFSVKKKYEYFCKKCGCIVSEENVDLFNDRWSDTRFENEEVYAYCNNCGNLSEEDVEIKKVTLD